MDKNPSRDTTTGLVFENKVSGTNKNGINVTKNSLYRYMKSKGLNWEDYISRRILPDEAYLDYDADELRIYEKKFQHTSGSADEKPQTCGFKSFLFTFAAVTIKLKEKCN